MQVLKGGGSRVVPAPGSASLCPPCPLHGAACHPRPAWPRPGPRAVPVGRRARNAMPGGAEASGARGVTGGEAPPRSRSGGTGSPAGGMRWGRRVGARPRCQPGALLIALAPVPGDGDRDGGKPQRSRCSQLCFPALPPLPALPEGPRGLPGSPVPPAWFPTPPQLPLSPCAGSPGLPRSPCPGPQCPQVPSATPHPGSPCPPALGPRVPMAPCPLSPRCSPPAPLGSPPHAPARLSGSRAGWQSRQVSPWDWGGPRVAALSPPTPTPPAQRQRPDLPLHQRGGGLHPLPGRGVAAPGLPGDPRLHPGAPAPPA